MKQVLQSYRTGELEVLDVPDPAPKAGRLLVRNVVSLVSAGTERNMLSMAKKSLAGKALARPDLVRQVIAKARAEGVLEAYSQAMNRLDAPVPLGYSSAGLVEMVGEGVKGFAVGDRVACVGSGYASHAELVSVPPKLCARIPDGVGFEQAAFVALGGIALEAVREAQIDLGANALVIGLGLLGQLTIQLLNAAGCHTIGTDVVQEKIEMALQYGMEAGISSEGGSPSEAIRAFAPRGVDAAILTAATKSNAPLELAAEASCERGRIVAAGLVGLKIPRELFFEKELEFVVSRAWGPGALDPAYVEKDFDFPYARWSAQRNIVEFLWCLKSGSVKVDHLITHAFSIQDADKAYDLVLNAHEPYVGILIRYPTEPQQTRSGSDLRVVRVAQAADRLRSAKIGVGAIGAGLFATSTLFPILGKLDGIRLEGLATTSGMSSHHGARKFGFSYCATDAQRILEDPNTDLVMVLTRHGEHARFVTAALEAGKHVFVEKPLAMNAVQLDQVASAYQAAVGRDGAPVVFVGFNRRHSPMARWLKERLADAGRPLGIHCTVNAGPIPREHWVHDTTEGGGRVVGEICHFVDLVHFLTDSKTVRVFAETMGGRGREVSDDVVISLKLEDGSIASITYLSGGDKAYPRERIEVFGGGSVGVIDNFREATFTRHGRRSRRRDLLRTDRGHHTELAALVAALRGTGEPLPSLNEYIATTQTTFAIETSLKLSLPLAVEGEGSHEPTSTLD